MMKSFGNLALILALAVSLTGCASLNKKLKALFNKGSDKPEAQAAAAPERSSNPRFSEVDNYKVGTERRYKRMNREQFEAEAQVGDTAGSLWVMEGQGAYLFAQNTKRLVGDFVNINIEGSPQQQLQTKTNVIAKLLKKLERGADAPIAPVTVRAPASTAEKPTQGKQAGNNKDQSKEPKKDDENQQNAQNDQNGVSPAEQPKQQVSGFDVSQVPARIVETLKDGSYRVKGSQQFMIGKREYKVIVTGIVRPEDFNEEGTSATKILDGQFDIVSNKKGATAL